MRQFHEGPKLQHIFSYLLSAIRLLELVFQHCPHTLRENPLGELQWLAWLHELLAHLINWRYNFPKPELNEQVLWRPIQLLPDLMYWPDKCCIENYRTWKDYIHTKIHNFLKEIRKNYVYKSTYFDILVSVLQTSTKSSALINATIAKTPPNLALASPLTVSNMTFVTVPLIQEPIW